MAQVKFGYRDEAGDWHTVTTLEEDEYPAYYHQSGAATGDEVPPNADSTNAAAATAPAIEVPPIPEPLFEGHREFQENQRGVSYETLLLPYLRGAADVRIVDPYIAPPAPRAQPR